MSDYIPRILCSKYHIRYPFNLHWSVEKYGRINHNIYRRKKKQVNYMKSYVRDITVAENSINLVACQQTIYLYYP